MKQRKLLVAAALLTTVTASAQLSVGVKVGYAMPVGAELGTRVDGNTTTTIYGSYGAGIPASLELGYMFNENFGVQLDATYLMGTKVTTNEDVTSGSESKTTSVTSQFRLSPQFVVKAPFGIYSRFGAALPIAGHTTATFTDANGGGVGVAVESEVVAKGKMSVGFIGAFGYEQKLGDKLAIFGEVEYLGLNIKRASTEITSYKVGGTEIVGTLPSALVNTEYEDQTTVGDGKAQGTKSNYSTFGLNVGVRLTL